MIIRVLLLPLRSLTLSCFLNLILGWNFYTEAPDELNTRVNVLLSEVYYGKFRHDCSKWNFRVELFSFKPSKLTLFSKPHFRLKLLHWCTLWNKTWSSADNDLLSSINYSEFIVFIWLARLCAINHNIYNFLRCDWRINCCIIVLINLQSFNQTVQSDSWL